MSSSVAYNENNNINHNKHNTPLSASMNIKKENFSKAPTKICSIEKVNKHHKKLVEKRKVHEYVSIFKTIKPDVP